MGTQRRRDKIGEVRRLDLLQDLFAVQRLHLGAVGLDDVHGIAVGPRFGDGALQHLLRVCAPHADLHSVFLLVGADQRSHIVGLRRSIEIELLLLLRALDQFLQAAGARIEADVRRRGVRLDLPETEHGKDGARNKQAREKIESALLHESGPLRMSQLKRPGPSPPGMSLVSFAGTAAWDLPTKNSGGRRSARPDHVALARDSAVPPPAVRQNVYAKPTAIFLMSSPGFAFWSARLLY